MGVNVHRVRRSPARATMLIVGGVVAVVVAIVLVSSLHGGGKSNGQGSAGGQSVAKTGSSTNAHRQTSSHQGESSVAASPASTAVVVLNGTTTNGLAHTLASDLQQGGYSRAEAMDGTPPGSHATTVVQYTSGHQAQARAVASALGVAQVQPIEAVVSSLAGSATVVVVAGEDKAGAVGETPEGAGASETSGASETPEAAGGAGQ